MSRALRWSSSWLVMVCVWVALGSVGAAQDATGPVVAGTSVSLEDAPADTPLLRRPLFILGAVLFAGSYVPGVVFASTSDWNEDTNLYVPVAGPWMDLSDPEQKPLSRALLINSGVMQGLGVVSMVASALLPSSIGSKRWFGADVSLSPTQMSGGYGLRASGSF